MPKLISALSPTSWLITLQRSPSSKSFFFFNDTATTEIYTLSLHDALPIYRPKGPGAVSAVPPPHGALRPIDRKSTRLNSSHLGNPVSRLLLKKKNKND